MKKLTVSQEVDEKMPQEELRALDEIRLPIGHAVHLQFGTPPAKYTVKLIGYLRGRSLIVSTPIQDEKVQMIREGHSFLIRMFSGRCMYSFSAQVLKVVNEPYPYLHLSYPAKVRGVPIRKGERARVNLKASVIDETGRNRAAVITNLSLGGCAMVSDFPLGEVGQKVQIRLRMFINEADAVLDLIGVIRSTREAVDGAKNKQRVQYGVQFVNTSRAAGVMITAYVYQALFDGLQSY